MTIDNLSGIIITMQQTRNLRFLTEHRQQILEEQIHSVLVYQGIISQYHAQPQILSVNSKSGLGEFVVEDVPFFRNEEPRGLIHIRGTFRYQAQKYALPFSDMHVEGYVVDDVSLIAEVQKVFDELTFQYEFVDVLNDEED